MLATWQARPLHTRVPQQRYEAVARVGSGKHARCRSIDGKSHTCNRQLEHDSEVGFSQDAQAQNALPYLILHFPQAPVWATSTLAQYAMHSFPYVQ